MTTRAVTDSIGSVWGFGAAALKRRRAALPPVGVVRRARATRLLLVYILGLVIGSGNWFKVNSLREKTEEKRKPTGGAIG